MPNEGGVKGFFKKAAYFLSPNKPVSVDIEKIHSLNEQHIPLISELTANTGTADAEP